ncbi:IgGFc-binding protein-like [Erpetoichthys calabaricus]|uniref:IgGFc-binding protein-like n=1 Tax=Erpetoichthys calabaricus TaxID=27687 RepID=UPI002234A94E|nr:IgGFc-binding protein-like [Erpetoichthys calabaricus]
MLTRPLLICCCCLLLINGVYSADEIGMEFAAVFPQNNGPSSFFLLELLITSYSPATTLKVLIYNSSFLKQFSLGAGQRVNVSLPPEVEIQGSINSTKTILVQASKAVSVLAVSCKSKVCGTTVLYPLESWGNDYYAVTPDLPQKHAYYMIVITNHEYNNFVEVFLSGTVMYMGIEYMKETTLSLNLSVFESVQLQGSQTLSSSTVRSRKAISVMSGFTCTPEESQSCSYGFVQLLPASSWGVSFVVPPLPSTSDADVVYVLSFETTQVNVQYNTAQYLKDILPGNIVQFQVEPSSPIYITASKGIQVVYFCAGTSSDVKPVIMPFILSILPTSKYCFNYSFVTEFSFETKAVIVAKGYSGIILLLDGKSIPSSTEWGPIKETDFSWGLLPITDSGDHSLRQLDGAFGLYVVGTSDDSSYAYPAICTGPVVNPCQVVRCGYNSHCEIHNNEATCVSDSKICWSSYPHYQTFDMTTFDFYGTCTYTLAQTSCVNSHSPRSFTVEAAYENLGKSSFLATVYTVVLGVNITILKDQSNFVMVNDVITYVPFSLLSDQIKTYWSGDSVVIETDFGLLVQYDLKNHVTINLAQTFSERVCGLCGNYNNNPEDDFQMPNGTNVKDFTDFGKSWKVWNQSFNCVDDCGQSCPKCSNEFARNYSDVSYCGILMQADGPFRDCQSLIDPEIHLQNCISDMCASNGNQSVLCQALKLYSDSCQRAGFTVYDWRGPTQCALMCTANSQYKLCGSACPGTCSDPTAPATCQSPCIESCQCNDGFLRIGNNCDSLKSCGCTYQNFYFPPNEKFWASENCSQRCNCDPSTRDVTCQQASCKPTEKCQIVNGIRDCYPLNFKTCVAEGDPHYTTFDGYRYNFQGTCMYQLAGVCSNDSRISMFDVQVQNANRGTSVASYSRIVQLNTYGISIEISKSHSGKIMVGSYFSFFPSTEKT